MPNLASSEQGLADFEAQPGSPSSCRVARRSRSSASSTKQRSQPRIRRPCNRREAEAVEREERERAKRLVAQTEAARTSLRLQDVATRYWTEVGEHHRDSQRTWYQLARLIEHFGKEKLLTDISDDDVAGLVAWRRVRMMAS